MCVLLFLMYLIKTQFYKHDYNNVSFVLCFVITTAPGTASARHADREYQTDRHASS